ncbi:hypothetical protein BJ165DRAFT_31385 [Panaeolus papilionaceus]|nr:hypothetical protein BJ165DRAFT_31385 [Panaeolus papilionaceus]
MTTSGAQRTPLVPRTNGGSHFLGGGQQHTSANEWTQDQARLNTGNRPVAHRQPFSQYPVSAATFSERSHRVGSTTNISDRSNSANEVERMLMHTKPSRPQPINTNSGWHVTNNASAMMHHSGQHHPSAANQKVHGVTVGFGAGPSNRNTRPSNTKFRPAIPK